jgi:hypothetical protein
MDWVQDSGLILLLLVSERWVKCSRMWSWKDSAREKKKVPHPQFNGVIVTLFASCAKTCASCLCFIQYLHPPLASRLPRHRLSAGNRGQTHPWPPLHLCASQARDQVFCPTRPGPQSSRVDDMYLVPAATPWGQASLGRGVSGQIELRPQMGFPWP